MGVHQSRNPRRPNPPALSPKEKRHGRFTKYRRLLANIFTESKHKTISRFSKIINATKLILKRHNEHGINIIKV